MHGLFGHPYDTWTYKESRRLLKRSSSRGDSSSHKKGRFSGALPSRLRQKQLDQCQDDSTSADGTEERPRQPIQEEPRSGGAKETFWPRDLLPRLLPQVRVFTWGYDVDISRLSSSTSQSTVFQHAGTLLNDVADARMYQDDEIIPLIFVAYSLGGIVVKDALGLSGNERNHLSKILPATVGVCFLGTPHRGSDAVLIGKIFYELSRVLLRKPATQVLKALEDNSETLDRIGKRFSQIIVDRRIKVYSFREEHPMATGIVVDASSYKIGDAGEILNSIPSDHENMTKYSSERDIGFTRVAAALQRLELYAKLSHDSGQLAVVFGLPLNYTNAV